MITTKMFANLELVNATLADWCQQVDQILAGKDLQVVMTPNPEQIVLAQKDTAFAAAFKTADYLIPDGAGLVWAGGLTARITGVATVEYILGRAREQKLSVLLIGGRYQDQSRGGKLRVGQNDLFYTPGYQNITLATTSETKRIQRLIDSTKPIVVMVALGAPHQELWLKENRQFLASHQVKLALAVGGSFDFLLGKVPRAPQVWQDRGLEWLWRLGQQPGRWQRQLALPKFVFAHWRGEYKKSQH